MKRRTLFLTSVCSLFFLLSLLASCTAFTTDDVTPADSPSDSFAHLQLTASIAQNARTIFPDTPAIEDFTSFQFSYSCDYESDTLATETFAELTEAISNHEFEVAEYSFTLYALLNGAGYEASKTQTLLLGTNSLSLELNPVSSTTGGISLAINFLGEATRVTGMLQTRDGSIYDNCDEEELSVTNASVTYAKSVEAAAQYYTGSMYRVIITFYGGDDGSLLLNTYKELVYVFPGITTSATRTITLNDVYTITYVTNGGEFATNETIPKQFTRKSGDITLPTLTQSGKTFFGWYETADFSSEKISTIPTGTTTDKTVYARFLEPIGISVTLPTYTEIEITYERTGNVITLTAPSGYDTYTWEFDGTVMSTDATFTKDVSSLSPETYDVYFEATKAGRYYSYYLPVTVSGIPSNGGIVDGQHYESLSDLATALLNMSDETEATLFLGSDVTNADLRTISTALQNQGSCSLTLDLSGCTSLTALSDEFQNKQAIVAVILPASLTTIGDNAFMNCNKLASVTFTGNALTTIKTGAFMQTALTTITFPPSLTTIESTAFMNTNTLTSAIFSDTSHTWTINGAAGTNSAYDVSDSATNARNLCDSAQYASGEWTRNE
ncbi:MAG: leucine-rich repeat protein [Treponema sp.]|nr:leucine-rich repeat protein [Treponema sp.]